MRVTSQWFRRYLFVERQLLDHVQQSLLVHIFMLEHHLKNPAALGHRVDGFAARHRLQRFENRVPHIVTIFECIA
jgi:hypothetical protein